MVTTGSASIGFTIDFTDPPYYQISNVMAEQRLMCAPPYNLDPKRRRAVLETIQEVCVFRSWDLLAAHVRTEHVHVVVSASRSPEIVMRDFKVYASRRLNQAEEDRKRWARHGSTVYLWTHDAVKNAIEYVVERQGQAMEVFVQTAH